MMRTALVLAMLSPFGLIPFGVWEITRSIGWASVALGAFIYIDIRFRIPSEGTKR